MSRVAVTILTNGSRRKTLLKCISSFLKNCSYRPLDFYILDNGSTDDTRECLNSLDEVEGISWNVKSLDDDIGCAAGTNMVSAMARGHEYVLHLESDFFHIPEIDSGFGETWLDDAVSFMDEERCDYLYLRRMTDEQEMVMHWWSQWMEKVNTFGKYMHCPGYWWSNNPHLRKDEEVYKSGALPLDESKDGPKGSPGWSKPEMETGKPGRPGLTWICRWGMFVHERTRISDTSCMRSESESECKYGFSVKDKTFCDQCDLSKGLTDMKAHEERWR